MSLLNKIFVMEFENNDCLLLIKLFDNSFWKIKEDSEFRNYTLDDTTWNKHNV